jgi:hypothetical protein
MGDQHRSRPFAPSQRPSQQGLAGLPPAVTEAFALTPWPYGNGGPGPGNEQAHRSLRQIQAKLRSKFPEDPTEHHAAMGLGSFKKAAAPAPKPSATKTPQETLPRAG